MRRRAAGVGALLALLLALPSMPGLAAADEELRAEQQRLESGADLASRAQAVLFRARARQDEGDFAGAARVMDEWLRGIADRDHHLLRYNLARSHVGQDDREAARIQLERAVALAPRFGRAWLLLAETDYQLGLHAAAATAFTRAAELVPDAPPELTYYAAVSHLQADAPQAALPLLTSLLDVTGAKAALSWHQALVAAAVEAGRAERARPYLDRLLAARAAEPEVWDLAYRFAAGQGDHRWAAVCLTVLGYLQPLDADASRRLGDLYAAVDVPRQAARYYAQAVAQGAATPRDHERVAAAWLAAHETERAREAVRTGLDAGATAELWLLLGDVEYRAEDHTAALEAYGRACERDAELGRAWLMRGWCAQALGRDDEARRYLTRAAEFPEQASAARSLLGR